MIICYGKCRCNLLAKIKKKYIPLILSFRNDFTFHSITLASIFNLFCMLRANCNVGSDFP
jgi:hypothetical protein